MQDTENTNLPIYEQQLRETESAIENILKAIEQGIFTKSTKERLENLEARKDELEALIASEKLAKPKISPEQMRYWLLRFRKLDMSKLEHRQLLIDSFVNSIYLYDDKMLIAYNYKDGTKTVKFDEANAVSKAKISSDVNCSGAPQEKPCKSLQGFFFFS